MVTHSRNAVLPPAPPIALSKHTLQTLSPEIALAHQRVIDAKTELTSAEEYLALLTARRRELLEGDK